MIKDIIAIIATMYIGMYLVLWPGEPFGPGYTWSLFIRKMQEYFGSYISAMLFFTVGIVASVDLYRKIKNSIKVKGDGKI